MHLTSLCLPLTMPALILGVSLSTTPIQAQKAPVGITDINTTLVPQNAKNSYPTPSRVAPTYSKTAQFLRVGSWVYFRATTDATGYELFRTNGVSYQLVADINPGKASSNPYDLTAVGSRIYFSASTIKGGTELWATTGSKASTMMVADLNPGTVSSYPREITRLGNKVVFRAFTPATGYELFLSDGTAKGTKLVKDMIPGPSSSNFYNLASNLVGNRVFFRGTDSEPWVTDGTSAGTVRIVDLNAGTGRSYPSNFTPIGPLKMLFQANDGKVGYELWITDGTAKGTTLVKDIATGGSSGTYLYMSSPVNIAHKYVVFRGNDGKNGYEPWITDGTAKGTYMLVDGNKGPGSGYIYDPANDGKSCYFGVRNASGKSDIYVTDGTKTGTRRFSPTGGVATYIAYLAPTKGKVYFRGYNITAGTGYELGVTDGTVAGTKVIADLNKGASSSYPSYITQAIPGMVVFSANDGLNGTELWSSFGTAATTRLFDINGSTGPKPTQDDRVGNILPFFGKILFTADDGKTGKELYVSDGSKAGTAMLIDIQSGSASSSPSDLTLLGGQCIFQADDGKSGSELWITNGTKAGTKLLVDIEPGSSGSAPTSLTRIGDRIYFTAYNSLSGSEAWVTDGTAAGTKLVADLMPGTANSYPSDFAGYRSNQVVFAARIPNKGYELILTDGTPKGTSLLKDISSGNSSFPVDMALLGGKVYFNADDGKNGTELWVTDFTAAGTKIVKDIEAGIAGSNPRSLEVVGNRLYFSANTTANGSELWQSDGTSSGTKLFLDLVPGANSSNPWYLTAVGSRRLYLASEYGGKGLELQSIDLATKKITGWDINGSGNSDPQNRTNSQDRFAVDNGYVYLAMNSTTPSDLRLWRVENEATATPIGQVSHTTRLGISDPVIGGTMNIQSTTAVANPIQVLMVGIGGTPAKIGPGNYSYINLGLFNLPLAATAGKTMKAPLPINNDKSLIGVRVVFQTWAFNPANFAGSLELSNGVHLTLGN